MANALIGCVYAGQGAGSFRDLVRQGRFASTTPAQYLQLTSGGAAANWKFNVADDADWDWTSGPFSVAAYFRHTVNDGVNNIKMMSRFNFVSNSNNQGWELETDAGSAKFRFNVGNNNANFGLATTTSRSVGDHLLVGTSDATTRRIYLNGVQEAATTNNPTPTTQTTNGLNATLPASGRAYVYVGYIWLREISLSEVLELKRNPFSLMEYTSPIRYFIPTAHDSGQTVTGHEAWSAVVHPGGTHIQPLEPVGF